MASQKSPTLIYNCGKHRPTVLGWLVYWPIGFRRFPALWAYTPVRQAGLPPWRVERVNRAGETHFIFCGILYDMCSMRSNPPPDKNPLGCYPHFATIGQNPEGMFFFKLALTCTSDPIRPTRLGPPDPNRPTYSKEGGCDLDWFFSRDFGPSSVRVG